jgi:hypothetical protein
MITPVMPAVALSGSINVTGIHQRSSVGERPMLPDSAPIAPKAPTASNNGQLPNREPQTKQNQEPEPAPDRDRTSTFAAAVIAGSLSPTPQTMEQLIIRIGASTIPEESQARLKDLLA